MSIGTPSPERLRLPPSGDDAVFSAASQGLDEWTSPRAELVSDERQVWTQPPFGYFEEPSQ